MHRLILVSRMPNARSLRRVALSWLLRAWAFLFCARAISFAACSYSGLEARPSSPQDLTTAAALVVVRADFPLLIFETPLDPPTGKGHPQERAKPGVGGSVADAAFISRLTLRTSARPC